jgi:putative transposase
MVGVAGMARPLRMESEAGVYHVINRGNYRADIFRSEKAKTAFLTCLNEACGQTGWRVHAWCLMSNHYHLAISTPQANLVEGMRWLQASGWGQGQQTGSGFVVCS